ncbi:MAG: hypothetical protein JXR83_18385 [Deltaproteobacteria bacterium]|nr:hypothetical protein [Deltaproteobacteria bacterium]
MTGCQMVGYIGTDDDRVDCAFHKLRGVLRAAGGCGYGVAHYTDEALLLNRRPDVDVAGHPFVELLGGVRTRVLIAHAFPHGGDEVQARDLHPFKFRSWAFAMTGAFGSRGVADEVLRAGLVRDLPDFILRDLKGHTCAEALFHRFLAQLHQAGQLDARDRQPAAVVRALRSALDLAATTVARPGSAARLQVNLLATDGICMYALRTGATVAHHLDEGIADCDLCYGEVGTVDSFALRESHQRFRGLFVAADIDPVPPGWKLLEEGAALVVDENLQTKVY